MQFALLVHESAAAFASRQKSADDPYIAAWRAYHNALVEADIYVGGEPLAVPGTAMITGTRAASSKQLILNHNPCSPR